MHLNHLNLPVHDLDAGIALFRDWLDFRLVRRRGDALAILHDNAGLTLVLMAGAAFGRPDHVYPGAFHIGFLHSTQEAVDAAYERLARAPIQDLSNPGRVHGTYGFYFRALDGVLFEVAFRESGD